LVSADKSCNTQKLDREQELAVNKIIRFVKSPLNEILDYVYFETEPMINASRRMEKLDFSTIPPLKNKKYFETDYITPQIEKILQKRYSELKKNV